MHSDRGHLRNMMDSAGGISTDDAEEQAEQAAETNKDSSSTTEKTKGDSAASNAQPKAQSKSNAEKHALVKKETKATGTVSLSVYNDYLNALGGKCSFAFILFLFLFAIALNIGNNGWLAYWAGQDSVEQQRLDFYLSVYCAIGICSAIATYIRSIRLTFSGLRAGNHLHTVAFENVVGSTSAWFDATPLGRIVNRFSKDVDNLDNQVIQQLG